MLDQLERFTSQLAPYTELRLHTNHTKTLGMTGGNLVTNSASKQSGVSARNYQDGAFGFASFPSLSDDGIPGTLKAAADNAALLQRCAGRAGDLPDAGAGTGVFDYRSSVPGLTDRELIEAVQSIDTYLRTTYPDLVNIDVSFQHLAIEKALATSAGALTYSYVPRAVMGVTLSLQGDDGIVTIRDSFGGFGDPQDQFSDVSSFLPDLDTLYSEGREKASGVYCKPGEHDVVLDSNLAGILAHEAIGHTCEADIVLGGSVAGEWVGKKVASDKITLVDYAERGPDGQGSIAIHVDDEGTPCRDITIIEDGVLKTFLHNKETARIMGAEPTGNARAYAYNDEPLVRMRNTAIKPGNDSLDDMIGEIEHGYYFAQPSNGQADTTSEFMFGVSKGYEIVNGELGRAVRDTTIAGVAFDMLQTVTHVSDGTTWSKGGMCGKKQLIPVGMGGPAIKCRIGVGGRA